MPRTSARAHRTYRTYKTVDDDQQQALFDDARNGSLTAYGDLLECQRDWLTSWFEGRLSKTLQSKLDADDLVQEVYCHACQSRESCRAVSIAELRAWLLKIGDNSLADEVDHFLIALCRTATREERLDDRAIDRGEQQPRQSEAALPDGIQLLIVEVFDAWLAALPERQRRMFVWHERDDRSTDDIAQELGCCTRTVRRACLAMRESLEHHLADDPG